MARDTLASLRADIELLKMRLAEEKKRDYNEAPLGDVSMVLLDRLDVLKVDAQDAIDEAESDFEKIERAYAEADSADDRIRELTL